jgi:hypothetical protein
MLNLAGLVVHALPPSPRSRKRHRSPLVGRGASTTWVWLGPRALPACSYATKRQRSSHGPLFAGMAGLPRGRRQSRGSPGSHRRAHSPSQRQEAKRGFALVELLSRRGLERPCETLVLGRERRRTSAVPRVRFISVWWLVLALAALAGPWLFVGCGGNAEPQASSSSAPTATSSSTAYVAALTPTYHTARSSFRATISPCVNRQYAACETRGRAARADAAKSSWTKSVLERSCASTSTTGSSSSFAAGLAPRRAKSFVGPYTNACKRSGGRSRGLLDPASSGTHLSCYSASGGYPNLVGQPGSVIRCIECGAESDDLASGWRAYLAGDLDEEEGEEEVVLYCPECERREFGAFDSGLSPE